MATSARQLSLVDLRTSWLGVVGFAVVIAAASQIAVPIPFTPVPFTLQPMLVVLAGMMLGPVGGVASMMLYLACGAAGLPVFTPVGAPGVARFFGPTGGYLIAYPAAAWVSGALALRATGFGTRWVAAIGGMATIYLGGIAQLTILNDSVVRALLLGVTPFALFDIAKAFVAALITRSPAGSTESRGKQ